MHLHDEVIIPIGNVVPGDGKPNTQPPNLLRAGAAHQHQVQVLGPGHPLGVQVLIVDLLAGLAPVRYYLAAVGLLVEIPIQQLLHRFGKGAVQGYLAILQDALQALRLFQDVAACVGVKQSGEVILYIPEPPLDDLRLGVAHKGVGHLDPQALEYRGRLEPLLPVLGLPFAVAPASDVKGQELAAVVHIDILRDAVLQNALAQRDQCCLTAGVQGNIAPGEDAAAGVEESCQMEAVPLAVVALGDHVKGVVVRDPPLVAGHTFVCAPDVGGAAVTEGFLPLAPQHLHCLRDVALDAPGKGGIAGKVSHQVRVILPQQQLHVLITLHHGVLGFLQVEVQESVPCLRLDVALALFPLAPLVDQAVQVVLLDGFPTAVQGIDGKFMLRVRLGAQGDEPVIGLGLAAGILAPIPLPIIHRFHPPGDLPLLLGSVVIQRPAGFPLWKDIR